MAFTNIILTLVLIINTFFLYMLNKKDNDLIRVFRFVNIGIIIWTFPILIWFFIDNKKILFILGIIAYWGPLLVSYSMFRVACLFPVAKNLFGQKTKIFSFCIFLIGILITLIPGFVLKEVGDYGYDLVTGVGIYLFFLIVILFALASLIIFVIKYFKSQGFYKYQLKYLFFGFFISIVIGFTSNAVLALLNTYSFVWIGPSITLLFIGFVTYSVTRYRFMGVRLIASKIFFYFIIALFSYIFFYFVYFFETWFLGGVLSSQSLSFGFVIAIIFAFVFLKVLNFVQKSSDTLFYKGYNPRRIIKDLVLRLSTVIKLNEILKQLFKEFKNILATDEVDVVIFSNNKEKKYSGTREKKLFKNLLINSKDVIYKKIYKEKNILVKVELDKEKDIKLIKELEKHDIEIIAPLVSHNKIIGLLILGKKISQDAYNQEDFEFLEIISTQAATAIENAILYKEVEEFNKNLQKKVDEQTFDIREKTDRLQKLLAMRSEFLDIASHQLRTPVSVIKGVLSMMKEGSVPDDRKQEFIESALSKSFKLEEVIDEILRASEMDSDKFEIDLEPIDLLSVLKAIYEDKNVLAKDKGLKFLVNLPKKLPKIMSNEKYIKHVIRNLINNSIQYTPKGSITLSVKKIKGFLELHVKDTGIGIPKKNLPHLFAKFSRGKNAVDVYTDGSGLGLFIMKKIIDAHPGGKVYIKETKVNKGTTMVLKLPLAK